MIYFTADNHFCHANIISLCGRPFADAAEMNKTMIANWNSLVTDSDEIYILGDFSFRGGVDEVNKILSKLKGKKYLIKGNHERYLEAQHFKPEAYEWIKDYYEMTYEKTQFVLFHYPMLSWNGARHRSVLLYGHVHNRAEQDAEFAAKLAWLGPRAVNVGVDVNGFRPVSIEEILERTNKDR
jgi:calcineurin-like phosphoesterase family protein